MQNEYVDLSENVENSAREIVELCQTMKTQQEKAASLKKKIEEEMKSKKLVSNGMYYPLIIQLHSSPSELFLKKNHYRFQMPAQYG